MYHQNHTTTRNCVSKTRELVFKMMNFAARHPRCGPKCESCHVSGARFERPITDLIIMDILIWKLFILIANALHYASSYVCIWSSTSVPPNRQSISMAHPEAKNIAATWPFVFISSFWIQVHHFECKSLPGQPHANAYVRERRRRRNWPRFRLKISTENAAVSQTKFASERKDGVITSKDWDGVERRGKYGTNEGTFVFKMMKFVVQMMKFAFKRMKFVK